MVAPSKGSVVVIPFPFSDLSQSKLRPALVLAATSHDEFIMCQITSKPYSDPRVVTISDSDFEEGSLQVTSYVRPGKIFTASSRLIADQVGRLKKESITKVINEVVKILSG